MNTILQKRIEEAARKIIGGDCKKKNCLQCGGSLSVDVGCSTYQKMVETANFILNNQWISVEEALPGYDEDVFVRFISRFPNNPNEFEIGYCTRWRTKDETVKTDPKGFSVVGNMEITHWMEIPSLEGGEK